MCIEREKTARNVKIRLDLTRTRLSILKDADELTKSHDDISFIFADINCRLAAKLANGDFIFFDSINDLSKKLDRLDHAAEE